MCKRIEAVAIDMTTAYELEIQAHRPQAEVVYDLFHVVAKYGLEVIHGILARCRHPLNTSIVEGINNTIKVIKRRASGYRDEEYFFLKIRAAFPGNAR